MAQHQKRSVFAFDMTMARGQVGSGSEKEILVPSTVGIISDKNQVTQS